MIRSWTAACLQGWADPAILMELQQVRDEKRQVESELVRSNDRVEQLETQVEFMMQAHEVNVNLLNRMNETHGFHAAK